MKLLFSIFYFLLSFSNPELSEVRKLYPNAANSESTAREFASRFSGVTNESTKTLVAYKGASIIMVSKYAKKVSDKIKNVKEGIKLIEFAVASEPNNIEIRLIRLSVQENAPKIVKYSKNKNEDVVFILAHYKEQSNSLVAYIKSFILQSKSFSDKEKQSL